MAVLLPILQPNDPPSNTRIDTFDTDIISWQRKDIYYFCLNRDRSFDMGMSKTFFQSSDDEKKDIITKAAKSMEEMKNKISNPTPQSDWEERFDYKFVKVVVKQVDTSNSIELPLWKDNHSHLSRDIKDFISQELTKAREEERERWIEEIRVMKKDKDKFLKSAREANETELIIHSGLSYGSGFNECVDQVIGLLSSAHQK